MQTEKTILNQLDKIVKSRKQGVDGKKKKENEAKLFLLINYQK